MNIYSCGIWTVKPGKETEFIHAWQTFANWTSKNQAGMGSAHLLQDMEHANRFLSFGPWESIEKIQEWRDRPEFVAFFAIAKTLCNDIQPGTFNVAAHITG